MTTMTTAGFVREADCLVLVNPAAAAADSSVAHEIEDWLPTRASSSRWAVTARCRNSSRGWPATRSSARFRPAAAT